MRAPTIILAQGKACLWLGHATRPLQRGLSIAACAASASLLAWQGFAWHTEFQTLAEESERLLSRQERLSQRKPAVKAIPLAMSTREVTRHNLAVAQMNTPWSDVFDGLERKVQADIGLTLLEPDTKKGTLRIQAEARDVDSLIAYAQGLASDPVFSQLSLQQHETNEQDPNRPARLTFEVRFADVGSVEGSR